VCGGGGGVQWLEIRGLACGLGVTHGRHSCVVTVLALLGCLDAGKLHIIHRN